MDISEVEENYRCFEENFITTKWEDVTEGQEVFIEGTHLGNFRAYGPHWIDSVSERRLINSRGVTFLEYPEDLLVRAV
jgi:hypothetical protein